jgi:arylsulfatase A-like enzyme
MPPNILLITTDQYRFPRFSYGEGGFAEPLKQVLGFGDVAADNPYARYFPGLARLREGAVLLANHTIAASACTPSRATLYTGQYGTRTGVTQTDGFFKSGDSPGFPWLADDGIPTLGTWLRAAGYTTHYFGKWHVSNPPDHSLERYGFSDWESSYPEPHGSAAGNLGIYRDVGFTDAACTFLRRKALGVDYDREQAIESAADPFAPPPDPAAQKPWFAILSLTNPHDIATYPGVVSQALPGDSPAGTQPMLGPVDVPAQGARSLAPAGGTFQVALNPADFPQACATVPPTLNEDLSDKPACQRESVYKVGLGLASKLGYNISVGTTGGAAVGIAAALQSTVPFALAPDPAASALRFLQLYGWLHAVVDPHIERALQALDDAGLAENTLVVFLADHGEYGAAHGGMMEKWYTAYQEALHVPVLVRTPGTDGLRRVDALTSHIDILPTVLGLAGVTPERRQQIHDQLEVDRGPLAPLPGSDLGPLLRGETPTVIEPDGQPRRGVLFITDDEITAPLPPGDNLQDQKSQAEFQLYEQIVNVVIHGTPRNPPVLMTPGAVCQPNNIRCVRTPRYKLARYFDPHGVEEHQWEMYDLHADPNEATNLVQVGVTPPTARTDLPAWADPAAVTAAARELDVLLSELEARNLSSPRSV